MDLFTKFDFFPTTNFKFRYNEILIAFGCEWTGTDKVENGKVLR